MAGPVGLLTSSRATAHVVCDAAPGARIGLHAPAHAALLAAVQLQQQRMPSNRLQCWAQRASQAKHAEESCLITRLYVMMLHQCCWRGVRWEYDSMVLPR